MLSILCRLGPVRNVWEVPLMAPSLKPSLMLCSTCRGRWGWIPLFLGRRGQEHVEWIRQLGIPPMLALAPGIFLPTGAKSGIPYSIELSQAWRRFRVGRKNSQCNGSLGTLPQQPLIWGPLKPLRNETRAPQWYQDCMRARGSVRILLGHHISHVVFEGRAMWYHFRDHGVYSLAQLGNFSRTQLLQERRTTRFITHLQHASQRRMHIPDTATRGARISCLVCRKAGPVSNVFRWLATDCHSGDFDCRPVIRRLEHQLAVSLELRRIIARHA